MAKAIDGQQNWLRVYRFLVDFHVPGRSTPLTVPCCVSALTPRGFEIWRAIEHGQRTLISLIGEATEVDVRLFDQEGTKWRRARMQIGDPDYLPFGVGIELGGQRVGRTDAMSSEIALEGVVFRYAVVTSVEDFNQVDSADPKIML